MTSKLTSFFVICLTSLLFFSSCFTKKNLQHSDSGDSMLPFFDTSQNTKKIPNKEHLDFFNDSFIRYDNFVYRNDIKSIVTEKLGAPMSPAIIMLNSEEKIRLSFDVLNDNQEDFKFTLIHCNNNWLPSDLEPYEYLEPFTESDVTDVSSSYNTIQNYYHYEITFPDDNMKILKSGNYVIKIYPEDNPYKPIITRRFIVYESLLTIDMKVKQPEDIELKSNGQEIDFTIFTNGTDIQNLYANLKAVVLQNQRWDNAIYGLIPKFVQSNELIYDYDKNNVFDGGNEFRNINIKSLKYQSINVKSINVELQQYHVYLLPDERRSFKRYDDGNDINGKFLIKNEDFNNSDISSEYVHVHFNLPYKPIIEDGALYVFGGLTGWQFIEDAKMKYNYESESYQCSLYLKQGYYDYVYMFLPNNNNKGEVGFIEGNHWETENDYMIIVYYKDPILQSDRIVGIQFANSIIK